MANRLTSQLKTKFDLTFPILIDLINRIFFNRTLKISILRVLVVFGGSQPGRGHEPKNNSGHDLNRVMTQKKFQKHKISNP
jgi:hypothetical protein